MALKLLFGSIGIARGELDKQALATVGQDIAEQLPAETAEELRAFAAEKGLHSALFWCIVFRGVHENVWW